MRTLNEIKQDLETRWMQSPVLRELYGWQLTGDGADAKPPEFAEQYSKASLENILLYIVAYCAYIVERIADDIRAEIDTEISTKVPGSLQWYVQKMKEFVYMPALSDGDKAKVRFDDNTGEYTIDNTLSEPSLRKARIIRHAVATDDNATSVLQLKIAGEDDQGALVPIDPAQELAFREYIRRIKYAGVKTSLVNEPGNTFHCTLTVYYDPLYDAADVTKDCREAITAHIKSLPFNGEYTNMSLTDALQAVSGVKVVQITEASYINDKGEKETITAKTRPHAGYFNVGKITINTECYE